MEIFIPESEVRFEFMRSGGPGGQNVNKVATKVRLFWDFGNTEVLNDEQKMMVREKLANRINKEGELYVTAEETRSQEQNRQDAVDKMRALVAEVLYRDPERNTKIPKKVKRKIKEKSLRAKELNRAKKQLRGGLRNWQE